MLLSINPLLPPFLRVLLLLSIIPDRSTNIAVFSDISLLSHYARYPSRLSSLLNRKATQESLSYTFCHVGSPSSIPSTLVSQYLFVKTFISYPLLYFTSSTKGDQIHSPLLQVLLPVVPLSVMSGLH